MSSKQNVVFAIYPTPKGFGYACLEDKQNLIDYGMVNCYPFGINILTGRFKKLITILRPDLVILQKLESIKRSKRVRKLLENCISYTEAKGLSVIHYDRMDIRNVFEQFGAKTKYEIAENCIKWFPELKSRKPHFRKIWMCDDYNMAIFDALSLAITHLYLGT